MSQTIEQTEPEPPADSCRPGAFEKRYLDGKRLRLLAGPSGALCLTLEGDRSYLRVKAARACPISGPDRYISLRDAANKEIGILRDPRELDPDSRRLLAQELRRRYLMPRVLRVRSVTERFGVSTWNVETDRGLREFSVLDHGENVRRLGAGRLTVQDVDGNRFEIPDLDRLDRRSREILDRMV
jgi:hypothetical protein